MTRVDFYILPVEAGGGAALFACRLAEKAYALDHRVYLLADSPSSAEQLDELLWTFRDGGFVPHDVEGRDVAPGPVLIGTDPSSSEHTDLLINLSGGIHPAFERYARVAEIIGPQPAERTAGRERFRRYRERGCQIETHTL